MGSGGFQRHTRRCSRDAVGSITPGISRGMSREPTVGSRAIPRDPTWDLTASHDIAQDPMVTSDGNPAKSPTMLDYVLRCL